MTTKVPKFPTCMMRNSVYIEQIYRPRVSGVVAIRRGQQNGADKDGGIGHLATFGVAKLQSGRTPITHTTPLPTALL